MQCRLTKKIALLDGEEFLTELFIAQTAWQRTRGLLGREPLLNQQGLLIEKCNSVHMIGMKYSIDLCYLNEKGIVLKTVDNFKPWRFSICSGAKSVVEMPSGTNQKFGVSKGQKIDWS